MLFWDRRMRSLPCTHVSAGRASGRLNSIQAAPGGFIIYAGSGAGEVSFSLNILQPQRPYCLSGERMMHFGTVRDGCPHRWARLRPVFPTFVLDSSPPRIITAYGCTPAYCHRQPQA